MRPRFIDKLVALTFGNMAYDAILDGKSGLMSALVDGRYDLVPIPASNTPSKKPRSRSIFGLGALLFTCGERIEVDEPWIVGMGRRLELPATMNPHQGLHAPSI